MKLVFLGSGELACPALRAVAARPDMEVALAVTQPDRPSGRRRQLSPCPLNSLALELAVPVITPSSVRDESVLTLVRDLAPDLMVVAAYGQFLPASLLAIPRHGVLNIHPSLLPRHRGAAPVQWTLIRGDRMAGVTILYVTPAMDAGDCLMQQETPVREDETAGELEQRLAVMGAHLLLQTIDQVRDGTVHAVPQDPALVTLAPKFRKEDGLVDFHLSAHELKGRIHGMNPWPVCSCAMAGLDSGRLRLLRARTETGEAEPGRILAWTGEGPLVGTGKGRLRLLEVQPPGKRAMSGRDFCHGWPAPERLT